MIRITLVSPLPSLPFSLLTRQQSSMCMFTEVDGLLSLMKYTGNPRDTFSLTSPISVGLTDLRTQDHYYMKGNLFE